MGKEWHQQGQQGREARPCDVFLLYSPLPISYQHYPKVNYPSLHGNFPPTLGYGVVTGQLHRFARICTAASDFMACTRKTLRHTPTQRICICSTRSMFTDLSPQTQPIQNTLVYIISHIQRYHDTHSDVSFPCLRGALRSPGD